jgi:2-hydroxy-3-keto-5-methylthiopentenyl-1-phosphate phosphatase
LTGIIGSRVRQRNKLQGNNPINAVVSDFNGTITKYDIAKLVLHEFAEPGWEKYDVLFAEGKISFRRCFEREYSMLRPTSKREILEFVRSYCELREGFKEFRRFCSRSKIRLIIASKGLDFILKYVFHENRVALPLLYSPKAKLNRKDSRWKVDFPEMPPGFRNFKEGLVHSLKKKGNSVAFIGDDAYDFWPAKKSDRIFAVKGSSLEQECFRNRLSYIPFQSFKELMSEI